MVRIFYCLLAYMFISIVISVGVTFAQANAGHPLAIPNLPFSIEMRRLDSAAEVLKAQPDTAVFLIGFNDVGRPKGTALDRIHRSKNYLIQKYHVAESRIVLLYGGETVGLIMNISIVKKSDIPAPHVKKQ